MSERTQDRGVESRFPLNWWEKPYAELTASNNFQCVLVWYFASAARLCAKPTRMSPAAHTVTIPRPLFWLPTALCPHLSFFTHPSLAHTLTEPIFHYQLRAAHFSQKTLNFLRTRVLFCVTRAHRKVGGSGNLWGIHRSFFNLLKTYWAHSVVPEPGSETQETG